MAKCECLSYCLFYNDHMANMPKNSKRYKENYCAGNNANCARNMVFRAFGKKNVPSDLLPSEQSRAKKIINSKKVTFEMPFDAY